MVVCLKSFTHLNGKMILFCSDSLSFVQAFHNMKSTDSPLLEAVCKLCAFLELSAQCKAVLCFIPGDLNLADPISRNQMDLFRFRAGRQGFSPKLFPKKARLPDFPSCLSGFF